MPGLIAAALVFFCAACVLVLEILAGRLLAPYVGISLETYTAIIGVVLSGIAAGSWLGGKLADRVAPRRLIGPTVALGGLLALLSVPVVRTLGDASSSAGAGRVLTVWLTIAGFLLPALVLSAVHPMVVKLQLRDLERTGGVVGRLSGIATLGAIVGTFVTGYVLVATIPTRTVIYVVGGLLIVVGIVLTVWLARTESVAVIVIAVLGASGSALIKAPSPCDVESAYFCIDVERDPSNPNGRTLRLDVLSHSYVDLKDPAFLEFGYIHWFADVVGVAFAGHPAIDALHIGGGGFTMPRYLRAEYPGSRSTVLEIDPAVLDINRDELGLRTGSDIKVRIGDARIAIRGLPADSADLVVGDAFASAAAPWHLTTTEFLGEVQRVLRPDGVYVLNLIDYPPLRFVRAEARTLQEHFGHVGLIAPADVLEGRLGGNVVLYASNRQLDESALAERTAADGVVTKHEDRLDQIIGDAPIITDDFAPIDQWLTLDRM